MGSSRTSWPPAAQGGVQFGCAGSAARAGVSPGDRVPRTQFKYVGKGMGEYELAMVPVPRTSCCLAYCGPIAFAVISCALLFAFVCWPTGSASVSPTTLPSTPASHAPLPDLAHQPPEYLQAPGPQPGPEPGPGPGPAQAPPAAPHPPVSVVQRTFLTSAKPELFAAGPTTTGPNSCDVGSVDSWDQRKRRYCCVHFNKGCSDSDFTTSTHSSEPYDCDAGLSTWELSWSAGKKVWCCGHSFKACPMLGDDNALSKKTAAATVETTSSGPGASADLKEYDCEADFKEWAAVWPAAKRAYCCEHSGRGCVARSVLEKTSRALRLQDS